MKTIKQIADELGVSKTAVRKKIANLGLRSSLQVNGNQFLVDETQENLIKSAFLENESRTENRKQVSEKTESLQLVSNIVDVLMEQLKEKDKQIERLQTELENAQKIISQSQQLHAMTEQKLLEKKEQQPNLEDVATVEKKRWWWFGN